MIADLKQSRLLLTCFLLLIYPSICFPSPTEGDTATPGSPESSTVNNEDLENEKLRQEILNLELENRRAASFWGRVSNYGAFITIIIGLIGVIFGSIKFITEWSR